MTALESLNSPLVLVLTRSSLKSIPSREALLALLKIHILKLPMGLIRDIEQRARLSQKLCDGYQKIFEANEISVFPAPLTTHQHDTRTLAPRHLAHLVSATIPELEASMPGSTTLDENPIKTDLESPVDSPLEDPLVELALPDPPPYESSLCLTPPPASSADFTVPAQATSRSLWRRFLRVVRLTLMLLAFTIGASSKVLWITTVASAQGSMSPKLREHAKKPIRQPTPVALNRDSTDFGKTRPLGFHEPPRLSQGETGELWLEHATCWPRAERETRNRIQARPGAPGFSALIAKEERRARLVRDWCAEPRTVSSSVLNPGAAFVEVLTLPVLRKLNLFAVSAGET